MDKTAIRGNLLLRNAGSTKARHAWSVLQDRHPMYVFLDLFLAAVILALGLPYLLFVWAILVTMQMLQARREEMVLAASFGPADRAYRSQTWL